MRKHKYKKSLKKCRHCKENFVGQILLDINFPIQYLAIKRIFAYFWFLNIIRNIFFLFLKKLVLSRRVKKWFRICPNRVRELHQRLEMEKKTFLKITKQREFGLEIDTNLHRKFHIFVWVSKEGDFFSILKYVDDSQTASRVAN